MSKGIFTYIVLIIYEQQLNSEVMNKASSNFTAVTFGCDELLLLFLKLQQYKSRSWTLVT